MGNAYWPGWLEAPTEGAGTQPGASLQLARLAFCHGQRERVKIPILRALQKLLLINHLFWSFCLLEFFTQMGNEWWWCRASKNEQKNSSAGINYLTTIEMMGSYPNGGQADTISFNFGLTDNLSIHAAMLALLAHVDQFSKPRHVAWQENESSLWPCSCWHRFTYAGQGAFFAKCHCFPSFKGKVTEVIPQSSTRGREEFFLSGESKRTESFLLKSRI